MLPRLLFISSFLFAIRANVVSYCNNQLVAETVTLFDNPRFSLDVVGSDNDSLLYMTIHDPIVVNDNLRLRVLLIRHDGLEFTVPGNSIELCTLLTMEDNDEYKGLTRFNLSKAFNMYGKSCPISPGRERLMPYLFPPNVLLDSDIGVGDFIYKTTIEECKDKEGQYCTSLITVDSIVTLQKDCPDVVM